MVILKALPWFCILKKVAVVSPIFVLISRTGSNSFIQHARVCDLISRKKDLATYFYLLTYFWSFSLRPTELPDVTIVNVSCYLIVFSSITILINVRI